MKQKNTIKVNQGNIALFEAMLCELVQTYMELFHPTQQQSSIYSIIKETKEFGEAALGNAEVQPNKE